MINIKNLSFAYEKPVLNGLSLEFKAGHIYGLLGRNGTGKSSLLRNIAGLVFPSGGSVSVNGFAPAKREPGFLQDLCMVPEEFFLPDIPVADYVKHYAPFYPAFDHGKFAKYLTVFEIEALSSMQKMSYGQKKKILIAFALATNAKLVLMDEPTNGLDIIAKSQFRKILAQAADEQRCIIVSTHQVKDLENLIDRVTVIEDGKILFDEDVDLIAQKLSFSYAYKGTDISNALYSESSLAGNMVVTVNQDGEEGKPDLELLYKAIVIKKEIITKLFQS